jgi:hypothetical protein
VATRHVKQLGNLPGVEWRDENAHKEKEKAGEGQATKSPPAPGWFWQNRTRRLNLLEQAPLVSD